MELIAKAEQKITEGLNVEGRSPGQISAGVATSAALVTASAAMSGVRPTPAARRWRTLVARAQPRARPQVARHVMRERP